MRFMFLCAIFGAALPSVAGTYVLKPLNPPSFPKNPYGGTVVWSQGSRDYHFSELGYGDGQADREHVECSGTITSVWVWQRDQISDPQNPGQLIDDPLDNPPEYVISAEYCYAWASATSDGQKYVSADNGLGFSATIVSNGNQIYHTSAGTLYTKRTGGQEITLTCTPSAESQVFDPQGPLLGAIADVWYSASILVPRVKLVGTTRFFVPQLVAFLTGQQITGSIEGLGALEVFKYSWRIDNATALKVFKDYIPTKSTNQLETHSKSDTDNPTYPFYTVKSGDVTVKCDLTLTAAPQGVKYAGGLPAFTAKSWEVDSIRPTLPTPIGTVTSGQVGLAPQAAPTELIFGTTQNGQNWSGVSYTIPDPFPQIGEGCFVQLITADREWKRNIPPPPPSYHWRFVYLASVALDTNYPYPFGSGIWNLPGSGQFVDSPSNSLNWYPAQGGGNDWYYTRASDSFKTWAMFRPPSKDSQPTKWIPMASYEWSWSGTAEKQGGQWQLTSSTGGGAQYQAFEDFNHPIWNTFSPSPFTPIGIQ